jgi:DNA-binding transcriptional ArsR family regulator
MTNKAQMAEEYNLQERLVIKDVETLKAISDPLKIQILEAMLESPRTVKQIAAELSMPTTKLYYHMNVLEEHGLVQVVDTRIVSGIIEKIYYITALSITVDPTLFLPSNTENTEGLQMVLTSVLDSTRQDILQSVKAGLITLSKDAADDTPDQKVTRFMLYKQVSRLPQDKFADFVHRLEALLHEMTDAESEEPADQNYALMLAFYPTRHNITKPNAATDTDTQNEANNGTENQ